MTTHSVALDAAVTRTKLTRPQIVGFWAAWSGWLLAHALAENGHRASWLKVKWRQKEVGACTHDKRKSLTSLHRGKCGRGAPLWSRRLARWLRSGRFESREIKAI